MTDYSHILLASDLSEQSAYVAERANEIAQESSATLSMIYVMEHSPVAYGGEYSIPLDTDVEKKLEQQARDSLQKLASQFHVSTKNQHIASGSVKLAVVDTAEDIGADLIVVGAHGHHGLNALLGSRANAILHNAKCDVLVIRLND